MAQYVRFLLPLSIIFSVGCTSLHVVPGSLNTTIRKLRNVPDEVNDGSSSTHNGTKETAVETYNNSNWSSDSVALARIKRSDDWKVKFTFSSRKQHNRVLVKIGDQFELGGTDFKIERRTVMIVHGFKSNGDEDWVVNMEKAFLQWNDVNVIVVDWGEGAKHLLGYVTDAFNHTQIVGMKMSQLLEHISNDTAVKEIEVDKWGPLHLVGHSLGAHICGFAAKQLKARKSTWPLQRITGLDPAHPCFSKKASNERLNKTDAPFVDIIHTNGEIIGLGLLEPIGHIDFYPNGGKAQLACDDDLVCSHGLAHDYFTESIISASEGSCSFWAHSWNLNNSQNDSSELFESCTKDVCSEMGINAECYSQRGIFFVVTTSNAPYCTNGTSSKVDVDKVLKSYRVDVRSQVKLYERSESFIRGICKGFRYGSEFVQFISKIAHK
ncbi:phospholipase A1-like [Prorops nasuta]|uniref:phospholipase A1-like n=1 Tax=Prorops nasuta TaxID=863751 RepID=UPI0034CF609E